jgi:hypothetical protein
VIDDWVLEQQPVQVGAADERAVAGSEVLVIAAVTAAPWAPVASTSGTRVASTPEMPMTGTETASTIVVRVSSDRRNTGDEVTQFREIRTTS